ncbi:alpha-glucan family phosphorylase [uncultured Nevskia sp.]|uniref:alpha-glucan family phosphorylase n=1 Tax=uncultured Nevskia sp. TaxID=228950 RepID=UPI0025D77ED5|nr:alpha-glucan family phosphorylase [uncultured Nevskia sp.]
MNDLPTAHRSIARLLPRDIPGFDCLIELALNLRWSWNHATDDIWRQLDASLWGITQNPWVVLQTVSRERIDALLAEPSFRKALDDLIVARRQSIEAPAWFQQHHLQSALRCVAYFSMEFMLSEALPIYSGGLGNVAGDQLKAASDLGVPVIGIGLLFQQGYFRQVIDEDGVQQALYPCNDPGQMPITPLRTPNGEWLRLEIALPGYSVWLRAWEVLVGRVKLYLLDSNDASNPPVHRAITSELYGGGPELRLQQELILGIGGWRLLEAMAIEPDVCHLNEGHAAFAVLERARSFMTRTALPFDAALAATRAGNLFTTHTAVAAGFDRFSPALISHYLGAYATGQLGIPLHDLLALGRANADDAAEPFNMAYLAIRGSGAVNGVSCLHGAVSRLLFAPLFPRWPESEVPIGHVTNGVHMPTWDSAAADQLWTDACGKHRWHGSAETLEGDIRKVDDGKLWQLRTVARGQLIDFMRTRLSRQLAASGASTTAVETARHLFNPRVLTLGFARRFATYKRPNLLLRDPARLLRLLANPEWPVQLVIAGKAHPADHAGQALIRQWIEFIRSPEVRPHIVFLSDYDMALAEHLVQGVDVWLNTPRRPWEASGTSGMKVLVNGGLNLSELDGWWAEAWTPGVGWALGDGREHADDAANDAKEADALYELLEREVIPQFYARNKSDIPVVWTRRIRESMAMLTPRFSASRAVREYTELHYLPAAIVVQARMAGGGELGKQVAEWRRDLEDHWSRLRFGLAKVELRSGELVFEVQVQLGETDPESVRLEVYAEAFASSPPVRLLMSRDAQSTGLLGSHTYRASLPTERQPSDFTVRMLPYRAGVAVPLEASQITWQR